jgi:hypothetical protein
LQWRPEAWAGAVLSQAMATRYAGTSVSDSLTEKDVAPAVAVVEDEFILSAEPAVPVAPKSVEAAVSSRGAAGQRSSGMTPLMQQYATAKQQHP